MFQTISFWIGWIFGFVPYTIVGTIIGSLYYKKYNDQWDVVIFITAGALWPLTLLIHLCYKIYKMIIGR